MLKYNVSDLIPNRSYSNGVAHLVYGAWESARLLNQNYSSVELSDRLLFSITGEVDGNVIRVFEDGSALIIIYPAVTAQGIGY